MKRGWMPTAALWALAMLMSCGAALAGGDPSLRLAYQDRIGSVMPIIALHEGYFKQEGLDLKPLQFSSGPACSEALYSGAADVAAMGDTAALIMAARASGMVMLASHATGEGRHRIMVRADSPLQTLADLKGKKLGVKKGTSTYGGVLAALDKAGIPAGSVEIIDLSPPTMTEALFAGSIDAFAASEPTPSVAETKGARQLVDLSGLGNEYPIMLLARKKYVAANKKALTLFFAALKKAAAYAAAHPEETARIMAAQTGLPLPATKAALARHVYRLRLDDGIVKSLSATADFLVREKVIPAAPDMAVVIDREFVN
ncbi:ABC transporter substrate-binding protein [Solidesulfovibrio sp. C21]|uniref:ABC transporter substrate-binding protein n=1 Tax=Solidesulfovibrio sp. C21 TaxID=3398613 RepID=UPI0039FBD706